MSFSFSVVMIHEVVQIVNYNYDARSNPGKTSNKVAYNVVCAIRTVTWPQDMGGTPSSLSISSSSLGHNKSYTLFHISMTLYKCIIDFSFSNSVMLR